MPPPSSGSFGGQCPSCGKHFANDSCVLRHMNHPRTSCQDWFQFLASMHSQQSTPLANRHPTPDDSDHEMADNHQVPPNNPSMTAAQCEVVHPNEPSIVGSGPGFMDQFHADSHTEKRSENIYYPFSCKEEWGLASWLSSSRLSMRAIDDFLSLQIVSLKLVPLPFSDSILRFSNFRSLSHPQKHYVHAWTSSQRLPNGRCKTLYSINIKPQSRLCYSTAIHSKSSRPSFKIRYLKDTGISLPGESMTVLVIKTGSTMSG